MKSFLHLRLYVLTISTLFFITNDFYAQTVGSLIGINARAKDRVNDKLQKFSLIREYHDWGLDEQFSASGEIECGVGPLIWNPSADGTGYVNFDEFYSDFDKNIFPVLKGNSYKMGGHTNYVDLPTHETKPYCVGVTQLPKTIGVAGNEINIQYFVSIY